MSNIPFGIYYNPDSGSQPAMTTLVSDGYSYELFKQTSGMGDNNWASIYAQAHNAGITAYGWLSDDRYVENGTIYGTNYITLDNVTMLARNGTPVHLNIENSKFLNSDLTSGTSTQVLSFMQSAKAICDSYGVGLSWTTKYDGWDGLSYYNLPSYSAAKDCFDWIGVMLYKGDYGKSNADITAAAANVYSLLGDKAFIVLQSYNSDSDVTPKTADALAAEVSAVGANAGGILIFRDGLNNYNPSSYGSTTNQTGWSVPQSADNDSSTGVPFGEYSSDGSVVVGTPSASGLQIQGDHNAPYVYLANGVSKGLKAYNYNWLNPVPAGATIEGIEVKIVAKNNTFISPGSLVVNKCKLIYNGSEISDNLLDTPVSLTTSYLTIDLGGNDNLWGAILTPAIVNDPSFGVVVEVENTQSTGCNTYIDYLPANVTFSTATVVTATETAYIYASNIEVKVGTNVYISAVMTDIHQTVLVGKTVDFTIDEVYVGSNKTDENGIAKLIYRAPSAATGSKLLETSFKGDNEYFECSIQSQIIINETIDYNKIKFNTSEYTGLEPRQIINIERDKPKLVVHCKSHPDEQFSNPEDEVKIFEDLVANTVNNDSIMNGSTDLQISNDGEIIEVIWQGETYNGVISEVSSTPDESRNNTVLYDLTVILELDNASNFEIFVPDLRDYPGFSYNPYNGGADNEIIDPRVGSLLGAATILLQRPVKRIEVTGNAANIPPNGAWLCINGVTKGWKVSSGENLPGDIGVNGIETLVFDLNFPATVINISTSEQDYPLTSGNTATNQSGALITQIKVYYDYDYEPTIIEAIVGVFDPRIFDPRIFDLGG